MVSVNSTSGKDVTVIWTGDENDTHIKKHIVGPQNGVPSLQYWGIRLNSSELMKDTISHGENSL